MADEHELTGTGWPEQPGPAGDPPAGTAGPAGTPDSPDPPDDPATDPAGVADTPDAGQPGATVPDPAPSGVGHRLRAALRRPSAAGTVIGLLLGMLGFALVVQLRSNDTDQLAAARPEDLVRILSDLDARKDRLTQEISDLQATEQQLAAGNQSQQAALTEATRRADELGILAGTLPARGPGVLVRFSAAGKPIRSVDVLDAVEELRGSGAEAMQIDGANGASVRIVASTSFVHGDLGLVVDGQVLTSPYVITAIGEPSTMQTALNIPGGVVDTVHASGGNVIVEQPGTVLVSALRQPVQPRYAHPAG